MVQHNAQQGHSEKQTALRKRAEKRLADNGPLSSSRDNSKLLHELQVHQVELEMQNEELQELRASQDLVLERYTELFEFAPLAYFVLNSDTEIITTNAKGAMLLDQEKSVLVGSLFTHYVFGPQRSILVRALSSVLKTKHAESFEINLTVNTQHIWVNVELKPDSTLGHCLVTMNDISLRKKAEIDVKLASAVYASLTEAIMVVDAEHEITAVNPSFTVLTGYDENESIGKPFTLIMSAQQLEDANQSFFGNVDNDKWQGEVYLCRKNHEPFIAHVSVSSLYDQADQVSHRVVTFSDISERKRLDAIINKQANYDLLTGLPNRQLFLDRLRQGMRTSTRTQKKLALLSLDIDKFKYVNDSFGHIMGDKLLIQASERISKCIREVDTIARPGGDEFSIIMAELDDLDDIIPVTQRILETMSEPFDLDSSRAYVSMSIGVSIYPNDASEEEALINNADNAMYSAKKDGRNQTHFYTPLMQQKINRKLYIISQLREALTNNEFELFYQPIIDLKTGHIHKAEALIRWDHPSLGRISPVEFIPIAEQTEQIIKIGNWVFCEAAKHAVTLRERYSSDFQISINKSPVQFAKSPSHDEWFNFLDSIHLHPSALVIEITEGLLMDDREQTKQQLFELNKSGMDISLDDFGTGYSSLSYLKKFHVDYLKIDQSFVKDLQADSDDMALCEAIIAMAHKLGIKVIAEGIETETHFNLLSAAGCDYGQGYYFSKALPAKQFQAFLDKKMVAGSSSGSTKTPTRQEALTIKY